MSGVCLDGEDDKSVAVWGEGLCLAVLDGTSLAGKVNRWTKLRPIHFILSTLK